MGIGCLAGGCNKRPMKAPMSVASLVHTPAAGREWNALLTASMCALMKAPMGIECLADGFNGDFDKGACGRRLASARTLCGSRM